MKIEYEIKKIITNKINEKSTLDYKLEEYNLKGENKFELVKDVIAMLNSDEAYDKNKFIILGIVDKTFYIKGLESGMTDDNEYQNIFNNIDPRPKIETGEINYNDKIIGYIFIDKNNIDRPYTISKDNSRYCLGTSFIRVGSTNVSLDNEIRTKMILDKYKRNPHSYSKHYNDIITKNKIVNILDYTDKDLIGQTKINPSNNNGDFTIGKGLSEFKLKFDVANNNVARIYNDRGIQVAKAKDGRNLYLEGNVDSLIEKLDFTNRLRRYSIDDLAIVVNNAGKYALIIFDEIQSENHGAPDDLISFKWKIL